MTTSASLSLFITTSWSTAFGRGLPLVHVGSYKIGPKFEPLKRLEKVFYWKSLTKKICDAASEVLDENVLRDFTDSLRISESPNLPFGYSVIGAVQAFVMDSSSRYLWAEERWVYPDRVWMFSDPPRYCHRLLWSSQQARTAWRVVIFWVCRHCLPGRNHPALSDTQSAFYSIFEIIVWYSTNFKLPKITK